jgi:hypothetical protein
MSDEQVGTSVVVPLIAHSDEMSNWLSSNCGGRESWWCLHWSFREETYTFVREEDTMAFKLRFGL